MTYRLYTADDFPALYAIEEACFEPLFRFDRGYMLQLVSSAQAATWIAEDEGRLAGFGIVDWGEEPDGMLAYIQTIEVAPDFRRQGVGDELMRRMEGSAVAAGAQAIWLHVDAKNVGAIRLYERNGYLFRGRKENYYPEGRAALIYLKGIG